MSKAAVPAGSVAPLARMRAAAPVFIISFAVLAAYGNSLRVPFVFDDGPAIVGNAGIRTLWPGWDLFSTPPGTTLSGRPIANITFAINYALSGTDVWSYHALNMLILVLSGLTLFGIVQRTLLRPPMSKAFGKDAFPLALVAAVLWTLHPLNTEAVTYVVQRVESLMGLFYLLTFYCFIRSVESTRAPWWQACSVAACLLGMGTKEVMVTAPLLALLYDRTFVAGTFRAAWTQRWKLYLALASTWMPLAFLVAGTGWSRHGSAGFTGAITLESYWLTQFEAVTHYLWLCVFPRSLVFDYGPFLAGGLPEAAPYMMALLLIASMVLVALYRWPPLGFLGAWVFTILAPTSIVPVATQTIAEHRMFLPLAAVTTIIVFGIYHLFGGWRRSSGVLWTLAICFGILAARRNEIYRSELTLWEDTVAKEPSNARAHCSLGFVLASIPGELPHAIEEYEDAIRIHPNYSEAHNDLGIALEKEPSRLDDAIRHYAEAVRIRPEFAEAHNNLGLALAKTGRFPEAIQEFEAARDARTGYFEACSNLGMVLCRTGRISDGIEQLEAALRINPNYAEAHFYLANAFVQTGQIPDAIQQLEGALRINPAFVEANNNLGMLLCRLGRSQEGIRYLEAAIEEDPGYIQAHFSHGAALLQLGRRDEAIAEFQKVLQLRPNDPSAQRMLDMIQSAH